MTQPVSRTAVRSITLAVTALVTALATPVVGQTYQTIAFSGRQAPGTPAGVNYRLFGAPALNDAGQVAFGADLSGTGVTIENEKALYAGNQAVPQLIARLGSAAPGISSGVNYLSGFSMSAFNDAGQVAYRAGLTNNNGGFSDHRAIYAGAPAALQLVARASNAAPATPAGVNYAFFAVPAINDNGQVAYYTEFAGIGVTIANRAAIYAGGPADPQLVARAGDAAPGIGAGVNYSGFNTNPPALNDAGQVAYLARLTGTSVTLANDLAIYAGSVAAPQLVARRGSAAPGTAAGVNYTFLGLPALNDAGQLAFAAGLFGTGVTAANNAAIYAGGLATPQLVARTGSAAPGTASGVNYARFDPPALNDAGQVACLAFLTGSGVTGVNDTAIYAGDLAALHLVVREGSAVPGTAPEVRFSTFLTPPALNDDGQVAYLAFLTGTGVTEKDRHGLFAFDPVLGNLLIARSGSLFDIDPTVGVDLRTIADGGIAFVAGRGDGIVTGLADGGTLAFQLSFTDGTNGIFTAVIPEPASLAAVGLAGVILRRRR